WTEAEKRGFHLSDIVKWMSTHVAEFLGLQHHKGAIASGMDADLVVWDPESACPTEKADIQHRHPVSPYARMNLRGKVLQTYVGGKIVFDQGNFPNLGCGNVILRKN
nr:amidohydrolase family protein [Bacteroidia bacterium]